MAGRAFSIKNDRMTSLVTDNVGFVSNVPARRFLLLRLAGSLNIKGKIPILPENS